MSLLDDVKKNLVEGYTFTSEETSEVVRVTARGYEKFGISRDIERQFSELGGLVYNGLKAGETDLLATQPVQEIVARVTRLEVELRDKEAEIADIKSEGGTSAERAQAAGAAATVITDPVLAVGQQESAILIEPAEAVEAGGGQGETPATGSTEAPSENQ